MARKKPSTYSLTRSNRFKSRALWTLDCLALWTLDRLALWKLYLLAAVVVYMIRLLLL